MAETQTDPINVLLVEDSSIIRGMLMEMLENEPDINVVGGVGNGELCLKELEKKDVDVVSLDIEMPVMDGIETLKVIVDKFPDVKVIMLSSLTESGSKHTLDALSIGASDFIAKPTSKSKGGIGVKEVQDTLIAKIRSLAPASKRSEGELSSGDIKLHQPRVEVKPEILFIGSSTGGPDALSVFFNSLTRNPNYPIFVVQHMPAMFTKQLAERIQRETGIPCREARDLEVVQSGHIYIAPGDYHMGIKKDDMLYYILLHQGEKINYCRPAVDPLFSSAAKELGALAFGVILTGMGEDGCKGSQEIVDQGGMVIAQDEETSVVWGMPGAVANAGICSAVAPVEELVEIVERKFA